MSDNSVVFPKLSKDLLSLSSSLLNSRTFLQSTKATSLQNSPKGSLSRFSTVVSEAFSPPSGGKLISKGPKTVPNTPKNLQINFEKKAYLLYDKPANCEEKAVSARTSSNPFRKSIDNKDLSIVPNPLTLQKSFRLIALFFHKILFISCLQLLWRGEIGEGYQNSAVWGDQ